MQETWTGPSGSRWEPVTTPAAPELGRAPRRRYRRPLVAVLLAALRSGAVTTGVAYAQGDRPRGHDHTGTRP